MTVSTKEIVLGILQISLFLLSRILDDMSWYNVSVPNKTKVFQGVGIAGLVLCVVVQIIRKYELEKWALVLFIKSQMRFVISWALIVTIIVLFVNVFTCQPHNPEKQTNLALLVSECSISIVQTILTNLNFSLICNNYAKKFEIIVYQLVLFGEIVFNGNLLIILITHLEIEQVKYFAILLISLKIANQILIMDLIFRASHEEKQTEQKVFRMFTFHIKTKIIPGQNQAGFQPVLPNSAPELQAA